MATALVREAPRRRRDPEGTCEAIIAAARAMMAERGPETLTVSDVAYRAGVNRTTAYQHFRTRDDLIGAVMARLADEVSRMFVEEMSPNEGIDHMIAYYLEHPEIARLWMFQMLSNISLPNRDGWDRYLTAMKAIAASPRTQDSIDYEMLAHILLAAPLVWSLQARLYDDGRDGADRATKRFVRELKRLLVFGVMRAEAWPELVAEIRQGDVRDQGSGVGGRVSVPKPATTYRTHATVRPREIRRARGNRTNTTKTKHHRHREVES